MLNLDLPIEDWAAEEGIDEEAIRDRINEAAAAHMEAKADQFGADLMRFVEKSVLLQTLDAVWKEHLLVLDQLRQGIYLRSYGQRDPLNEYKSEAFALFNAMLDDLKQRVTATVTGLQLQAEPPQPPPLPAMMWENHPEALLDAPAFTMASTEPVEVMTLPARDDVVMTDDPATWRNTPRNALCPCGSGKKFKHCHGRAG